MLTAARLHVRSRVRRAGRIPMHVGYLSQLTIFTVVNSKLSGACCCRPHWFCFVNEFGHSKSVRFHGTNYVCI